MIHGHTLRTLIGTVSNEMGPFYYKRSATNLMNAFDTRCLWHRRLGHASKEVLSYLPQSLGILSNTNKIKEDSCEIHFRAKQTYS